MAQMRPKICDPAVCDSCQYIGEGDFYCDVHQEIVVSDWEPTSKFMVCQQRFPKRKRRRKKRGKKNNG